MRLRFVENTNQQLFVYSRCLRLTDSGGKGGGGESYIWVQRVKVKVGWKVSFYTVDQPPPTLL